MIRSTKDLLTDSDFRRYILNPQQGDSKFWDQWKNLSPENHLYFDEAQNIIKEFYEPLSAEEFQIEAIAFKRKIDVTNAEKKDIISLYESRRPSRNPWLFRIAAAITFVLATSFGVYWFVNNQDENANQAYDPTQKMIRKQAEKGHKRTLMLPDGSIVKLNSESYITYPEKFSEGERNISLSGEAYFDIEHHDNWPFIVNAKNVYAKVLGTSFNVSSYPEDIGVMVALVEGKVEVMMEDKPTVQLTPMEMAKASDENDEIIITNFDINTVTSWKDNRLFFDGASFDEVESTLERWYNVEIIYDKKPVFEGYEGDFENKSLEFVLKGIGTDKFEYELRGNKYYIY